MIVPSVNDRFYRVLPKATSDEGAVAEGDWGRENEGI